MRTKLVILLMLFATALGCSQTIQQIITTDTPNSGMTKINNNFLVIVDTVGAIKVRILLLDSAQTARLQAYKDSLAAGTKIIYGSYFAASATNADHVPWSGITGTPVLIVPSDTTNFRGFSSSMYALHYSGSGPPSVGTGKNGDSYWDTTYLYYYVKSDNVWRQLP